MRSWREAAVLAALSCGSEDGTDCKESPLTWSNSGQLFTRDWCTGCHSSLLEADDRQGAPLGVDFDTLAGTRRHLAEVEARVVVRADMPPAGGPDARELGEFAEWLACGAPGKEDQVALR